MQPSSTIETIEDIFHFRQFSSSIYKVSNSEHKAIKEFTSPEKTKQEVERIEIQIIEDEHDIWIEQTKV